MAKKTKLQSALPILFALALPAFFSILLGSCLLGDDIDTMRSKVGLIDPDTALGTELNPIPLTSGTWTDGSITSNGNTVWYSFNVYSGYTYYVWWDDSDANQGKTSDVRVSAYYSNGTSISNFIGVDTAWTTPQSFYAYAWDTVKIKVESYSYYYSGNTGTFAIAYSTSSTRPSTSTLSAPTGVTASASSGRITVSWYSVSGADRYYIYRSATSGGGYSQVGTSYTTSFTDYVSSGTTYYYRVAAINSYGTEGTQSSYVSATAW